MYQLICFSYYALFQYSYKRRGDAADAKVIAERIGWLYAVPLSIWSLYALQPLTGIKTALEHIWQTWWGGQFDPRLGSLLFAAPLTFALVHLGITRRHDAIAARFAHVKLPQSYWLFSLFIDWLMVMALFALGAATNFWPIFGILGMILFWLLVGFVFRAWLKRNTLPAT